MKLKRFLLLVLCSLMLVVISGCEMGGTSTVTRVTSIEKDPDSFESNVVINQFDIRDWYIFVNLSDGTQQIVQVGYNMLEPVDTQKLVKVGTHTLTFTYEGKTLEHSVTITEPNTEDISNLLQSAMSDDLLEKQYTSTFILPTSFKDVEISWSVDSEYIKINGTRAVVTRPTAGSSDETVTLNATFKLYDQVKTRTYSVIIPASGNEELIHHMSDVVRSISIPTSVSTSLDLPFVLDGVNITWSSDNECITINNTTKSVVVTEVLEKVQVKLTCNLEYKGVLYTEDVTYDISVLPQLVVVVAPSVTNLRVVDKSITWNSISGINKYNIYANNKLIASVSSNTVALSKYLSKAGTYVIGVQSVASGVYNTDSSIVTVEYVVVENSITYTGIYYDSTNLNVTGSQLKTVLRNLLKSTHKSVRTYDNLKTDIPKTDKALDDTSKVLGFYSRVKLQGKWSSGGTIWNREHVWPQSKGWFTTSAAGSDLHHLRPEDPSVNSARGNTPFGNVTNGSVVYLSSNNGGRSSNCYRGNGYFEPQDSAKGDTARIIFYLLTRYSESDSYSITSVARSFDVLLEWNDLDPVDEWEMNRNDITQSIQGNRNPFIDHPELAREIWG